MSSFFCLYIALLALTGFPLALLNPAGLIVSNLLYFLADSPRQKRDALLYAKAPFNFGSTSLISFCFPALTPCMYACPLTGASYPQHLLVFLIGCSYAILSPLILPFLMVRSAQPTAVPLSLL